MGGEPERRTVTGITPVVRQPGDSGPRRPQSAMGPTSRAPDHSPVHSSNPSKPSRPQSAGVGKKPESAKSKVCDRDV